MKKKMIFTILFTFIILFSGSIFAQEEGSVTESDSKSTKDRLKYSLNMCPGGIVFGIFSANIEYLFNPSHGLVVRFDYESIPKNYTEASIEASGVAFILNYRWHFSNKMNSVYLGAFSRYRVYKGKGTIESTNFEFTIPELTIGLNIGKRWVWKSGFNINLAFGYGISKTWRTANPSNSSTESMIDAFENAYDFIDPFLGEFSIGYAF